jgi:hypothetical protein
MPRGRSSRQPAQQERSTGDATEQVQYDYRGRTIKVQKGRKDALARASMRLFIDDQEVEIEQTESGVHSHAFMFKEFGTPFELAEELIKQWGDAEMRSDQPSPPHPHH